MIEPARTQEQVRETQAPLTCSFGLRTCLWLCRNFLSKYDPFLLQPDYPCISVCTSWLSLSISLGFLLLRHFPYWNPCRLVLSQSWARGRLTGEQRRPTATTLWHLGVPLHPFRRPGNSSLPCQQFSISNLLSSSNWWGFCLLTGSPELTENSTMLWEG